eukprot:2020378-Alexandrium_andersonii.AAC.1
MAQVQQVAMHAVTVAVPPRTARGVAVQTAVAASSAAQTKPPPPKRKAPDLPARVAKDGGAPAWGLARPAGAEAALPSAGGLPCPA